MIKYDEKKFEKCWKFFSHPRDWKKPVKTCVTLKEMKKFGWTKKFITTVIEFYTATTPTFKPRLTSRGEGYFDVNSDGYRMGPAGDC